MNVYYVNQKGLDAINKILKEYMKPNTCFAPYSMKELSQQILQIEQSANEAQKSSGRFEIPGHLSKSGNPEAFTLFGDEHYDIEEFVDEE
ncbi:hypothetical protein [Zophobihabitans entericus]|uniref:Uncharacterized protein n=1 Tax=Zophobihabitans entericus TaxID=1635327 RepID=A0A6G9IE89_9GAMM|nr:hypothetical protein [Zophobihabitans entericus]QIQ22147.1 hypothetical protein IPMB12_10900 [Zophobihabitans entericus]